MATYRVLIVDDQRELRMMLKSAVETLGPEFDVVAVPSGEEAFLEIRGKEIDLLISDIILPGITGLELLQKVRVRNPDLKVILVTGSIDRQTRRDVADAGADAFFLKPMETADFLDSVERILGLVETKTAEPEVVADIRPAENVSERLANLRQELDSISAVLIDERGRIVASAGDLPDASLESSLLPSLMAALSASERVARFLGANPPRDLSYFSGSKYDLIIAHVGEAYSLLVVINPIDISDDLTKIVRATNHGVDDLLDILLNMGIPLKAEETDSPLLDIELDPGDIVLDSEEAPLIDALFQGVSDHIPHSEAVDAFWSSVSDSETPDRLQNADALTYEQAVQLGLAPPDEE